MHVIPDNTAKCYVETEISKGSTEALIFTHSLKYIFCFFLLDG